MQLIELFFKNNNASKYNRELTDYLRRNIKPMIINGQLRFKFRVIDSDNQKAASDQGIKRFPAMKFRATGPPVIGVPEIISQLQLLVKNNKVPAKAKTNEEELQDFFNKTLDAKLDDEGKFVKPVDDDDDQQDGPDMGKMQAEMARRAETASSAKKGGMNGGGKNNAVQAPAKPSRATVTDDDYEEQRPTRPAIKRGQPPREDNVEVGDPINVMNSMRRGAKESTDDVMLSQLMAKLSDE